METIKTLLNDRDIKASYTRIKIMEYVIKSKSHPTADEIYQALVDTLPTLSKTTVYNILSLFVEKHLVRELKMKQQMHYDYISHDHAHFHCEKCNTIYDINVTLPELDDVSKKIYKVNDTQLTYHGICQVCQNQS